MKYTHWWYSLIGPSHCGYCGTFADRETRKETCSERTEWVLEQWDLSILEMLDLNVRKSMKETL